jgi:hypothetical protein
VGHSIAMHRSLPISFVVFALNFRFFKGMELFGLLYCVVIKERKADKILRSLALWFSFPCSFESADNEISFDDEKLSFESALSGLHAY